MTKLKKSDFVSCNADPPSQKKRIITSKEKIGWQLTINAMKGLYADLRNSGFEYVMIFVTDKEFD